MAQKLKSWIFKKKNEEKWFLEHGSSFLKRLITDCNGKSIPIRNFSSSQIRKATNNFGSLFVVDWSLDIEWFKGIIEDKPYLIRRYSHVNVFNDIVLSARMSNHNNFLKLIGYCFEFSFPVVVFEYAEHGCLSEEGHIMVNGEKSILPWNVRLKIAKEVAIAITYLHTAFPRIIIHKNINPTSIFVDKNWNAKLTDFTFSVLLPEGKSRIEDEKICGTIWYIDPVYIDTFYLSGYTDMYSFGVCLLVFVIGKSPNLVEVHHGMISYVKCLYENGKLDDVIDPMIVKDITSDQRLHLEAFVVLALRCCEKRLEDRPKMIYVAKELKRIQTSF